jgi:mannan endo-1,4-beta-mannosidase
MNKKGYYNTLCTVTFLLVGNFVSGQIDKDATKEAKALYKNLKDISKRSILFAHQHATEYGHGWSGDANRSDVKSVT